MEFKNFNLHPDLQKGIDEAGYINCMPVQEQVLNHAFGGQDLYVQSQTGTGKTAAFLVVIFQRMLTEEVLFKRKALIMAPTRELAVQIEEEAKMLGKYLPFKTGSFYGGVGYTQQEKLLRENAQILVGTPGRVIDLNKSGRMNLMDIAFLILDEADRMFDMGFYPDLRKLIKVVPPADRRQTMLFSATLNAWVKNLAWEYTKSPFEIEIEPEIVTVEEITQILYHVPSEEKMPLLLGVMKHEQPESAIIFCNTKKNTEIVAKRLKINGYDCEFIIGDLPQSKRLKVIDDVKAGKIKILVATDVAARGLDIESLAMVINYDLPNEAENYVHRIGRTARAGKTGKAVTLSSEQDVYELPAIERYIGKKIPSQIAGQELYEDDKSAGQNIHTDFYEERHHSGGAKGVAKNVVKGGGKRRDDRKKQVTFTETRQDRGSSPNDYRKEERRKSREHGGVMRNNDVKSAGHDMLQLSMEARMAHYKKKYAGGETKHGGKKDHSKRNVKHHNHSGSASQTEKPNIEHVTQPQKQAESAPVPAKKGILSKLTGLFKKK
ncbi:MAG: DEAD/DEAH box helicase [Treponema sp.]|jgi:ATP-dependent RNA helicase RhlB|nr:DEAD/DEAH box helicase [Treponema sp.]